MNKCTYTVDKWLSSALIDTLSFYNLLDLQGFLSFLSPSGVWDSPWPRSGRIVPLTSRFLPGSFHKQQTESICLGGKQKFPIRVEGLRNPTEEMRDMQLDLLTEMWHRWGAMGMCQAMDSTDTRAQQIHTCVQGGLWGWSEGKMPIEAAQMLRLKNRKHTLFIV